VTKIVLISLGVGTMFFVPVTLAELFVAGDLSGLLDARRMQTKIAQLKDHYKTSGHAMAQLALDSRDRQRGAVGAA
jgi:hypothetical protein